jgi:hypothetical protein
LTKVDPFLHPIPLKLQQDPEIRQFFEYFVKWAHDIWLRTGGSADLIASGDLKEVYAWIQEDYTKSDTQYLYQFEEHSQIITKTIDNQIYTAVDNMFIYMKNNSTLYLPANPIRNSVVYMTKDSTRARVNGNGKNINGKSEYTYYKPDLARVFQYFIDSDEWRIR